MKNIILLFVFGLLFIVGCKKDEPTEFTATDVTGTTLVKGRLTKNIIIPDGAGSWTNSGRIGAEGINVSVKINKNSLYPNSSAQGADVYSGTSDKDGNYSITVRSNATGVQAQITIDGFSGSLDTLINGTIKKGFSANFLGSTKTNTLFMGQNYTSNFDYSATQVNTNPNAILTGSATVSGSVGVSIVKEIMTGTLVSLTTALMPLANQKVYLNINQDPLLLQQKLYEVNTDANGAFSFNVTTVALGTAGFTQNVALWVNDRAGTRDTLKIGGILKTGRAGVFTLQSLSLNGVYSNQIRNANNLNYTFFIPD